MGRIRSDRLRRGQRLPRRDWPGACASRASPDQRQLGPWSAGMADAESRARLDQRGVRTSPADALAGLADVVAASSALGHQGSWPGSTGPASCRSTSRRGGGHSWRSWSARCLLGAGANGVREDPVGRAAHQCSGAAAQEASDDYLRDAVAEVTRASMPRRSARTRGSSTSAWIR